MRIKVHLVICRDLKRRLRNHVVNLKRKDWVRLRLLMSLKRRLVIRRVLLLDRSIVRDRRTRFLMLLWWDRLIPLVLPLNYVFMLNVRLSISELDGLSKMRLGNVLKRLLVRLTRDLMMTFRIALQSLLRGTCTLLKYTAS